MDPVLVEELIVRWRDDPGGAYRIWFLWPERLKNFRAIRRGVAQVVAAIEAGTFGKVYKGSSLETVVGSIAEQRQVFKDPHRGPRMAPRPRSIARVRRLGRVQRPESTLRRGAARRRVPAPARSGVLRSAGPRAPPVPRRSGRSGGRRPGAAHPAGVPRRGGAPVSAGSRTATSSATGS